MNERDIFLAAIEITDPARRAAYVEQACGSDATLRVQVEELLKTHAQSSQFLETPALAAESAMAQTFVTAASHADEDPHAERASAEAEFRKYLQPAIRTGWLGRLGHYEIEAILGRGAFGIVAKAFDEKLHRVVAIKLMNPELAATSPPRKRFLREARTAAAVTHENIVAIYAVEEDPIPYLVMEYIPGQTLQQWLDEHGPLEPAEILRIGRQVAAGLAAAHAANLIHRDIKPSNILMTGGAHERAKISDFGLARAVDDATMTSSGLIAGTPMYMAPEQARGETLDHRADLFSLGSVFYQMASGRPPFRAANTVAVLKRVCEDTPRPLADVIPGIPGWLETIVFRLLEKDRDDRYQTAQEVADLLARCQSELQHQGRVTCVPGRPTAAETQVLPARRGDPSAPGRWPIGWLAGGVLAVVAVIGLVLSNGGRQKPEGTAAKPPAQAAAATAQTPAEAPAKPGWHGWPADAAPPAIAPFDAEQAKQHQEAWAKYLGVPVEYTNSLGMKFRLIPPGEFKMGSTKEEIEGALKEVFADDKHWQECIKSEAPQHKVILTKPIYLGVDEVTQAEYEKVMGVNPSHFAPMGAGKEAVAGLETTNHPVETVSWNDAAEFCAKLSQQEKLKPFYFRASETITPLDGTGYRLPSEAEWEFACRAGTATKYWIGDKDEELLQACWFTGNDVGQTHPVGALKANPFGLYDIHGNVKEWVQDGWDATYYDQFRAKPAINPNSPFPSGRWRVFRGGSYYTSATYCRSSDRSAVDLPGSDHGVGFRVALSVDAVRQALKVDGAKIVKPGVLVGANGNPVAEPGRSAWDDLDPAQIPEAERVPRQPEGLVAVLGQHRQRVWARIRSVAVTSDGRQFLSTTDDGIYLFDQDPQQTPSFFPLDIGENPATFLPDGRIATFVGVRGKQNVQLQVFAQPQHGAPLKSQSSTDTNEPSIFHSLRASSDGLWMAAWETNSGRFALWNLREGVPEQVASFPMRARTIPPPVSFSPDANWFCFTDNSQGESTVHLVDLREETPSETHVLKADGEEKSDVPAKGFSQSIFLADGRLATADGNGRIWFWKLDQGEPQRVGDIRDPGGILASHPSSSRLVVMDGSIFRVWELGVEPPKLIGSSTSSFPADNIFYGAIAPDGQTVMTSHLNGSLRFWNVSPTEITETGPLAPNPRFAGDNFLTEVFDDSLCSSTEQHRVGIWRATPEGLQGIADSPPAHLILRKNANQRVLIVSESSVTGGTLLLRREGAQWKPVRRIDGIGLLRCAALSDDGHRLAIGRNNGTEEVIELWGWESGEQPAKKLAELKAPHREHGCVQLAFSDEGRTLVGRFSIHAVELWDVKDDQLIRRAQLPLRQFYRFAMSPDGRTLATVGYSGLELWDLKSDFRQPKASFAIGITGAVAFSPDGRHVAASFRENGSSAGVKFVNLATGIVEKSLTFPGVVYDLDYTDDGRHLVSGNANGTIYVVRLAEPAKATSAAPKPIQPWHNWPANAPKPAIAPFNAAQAKKHQDEWAAYLKVPVEYTNSIGMKFRLIPPGEFTMGSTKEEIEEALKSIAGDQSEEHWQECIKSEGPKHKVTLRQGFYLGMHEVTQQEYEKVVGANPSNFAPAGRAKEAVAGIDTTRHPVENVTWDEAVAFCVKLNHQEEFKQHRPESDPAQPGATPEVGYRLPTDAEWDFACRAGTISRYWIGVNEEELSSVGWFSANSAGRTHRVGELNPNPFGLFDVHGNVFEYVRDWWNPTYFTELQGASAIDPSGPTLAGSRRVVRSASYGYKATYSRVSSRGAYLPAQDRNHHIGFRVSLPVDAVRQALKVDGAKIVKPGVPVGSKLNPIVEQGRSAWDDLDPAQIPAAERVPGQPEGLVAVLGQHRRRLWGSIYSTAVSADGSQFMLTTWDTLHLFDRDVKKPSRTFKLGDVISSATFLPDGRIAAFVSVPGKSSVQLQIFAKPREGEPLELQSTTNSDDGSRLAIASSDGHWLAAFEYNLGGIVLWKLSDTPPRQFAKFKFRVPYANVPPLSFSPDAKWFCFTDLSQEQSTIHLIDLRGDTPREAAVLKADADEKSDAPAKGFLHAVFLADGRLATADRNGCNWLWKMTEGEPQRAGKIQDSGVSLYYAPSKSLRLVVSNSATFGVWGLTADPPRLLGRSTSAFPIDNIQDNLRSAPDGDIVFTGHLNGAVRFWNVSQAGVTELDPLVPNPHRLDGLGTTKVLGQFLCASQESVRIGIWRPTRDGLQQVPEESSSLLVWGTSRANRQLIVGESGGAGGTALFRSEEGRVTPTRRITGGGVRSTALNDAGHRLALGRHNGAEEVIELWGWESEDAPSKKLAEVKSATAHVVKLAFADGGRSLVSRHGSAMRIWDVQDDQLVSRTMLPEDQYHQFAIAPDGVTLATVGHSGLRLWNLKSDLKKSSSEFVVGESHAVAFSPDGKRLAAASGGTGYVTGVQIINLASGVVEKRLSFPGPVHQLDFTDDSRHLVTGNANGTIYVVRLAPPPK